MNALDVLLGSTRVGLLERLDEVSTWVRQMAERVLTVWHEHAADIPFLAEERALLDAHARRVPLARDR